MKKFNVKEYAIEHFEECIKELKENKEVLIKLHDDYVAQNNKILEVTGLDIGVSSSLMNRMIVAFLDKKCRYNNTWDILVMEGVDEKNLEPLTVWFESVDECIDRLEQVIENIK